MKKNKIYHLTQCNTCKKVLAGLNTDSCALQDIKEKPVSGVELDELAALAGSYEALFSRKAMKYRAMGLHLKTLGEKDFRRLILSDYTFLKRPVIRVGEKVFSGSAKAVVDQARLVLG